MLGTNRLEPTFGIQWTSFYDLSNDSADDRFQFSLRYAGAATDDPIIEALIADLSIDPELPDSRSTWHRNYPPLASWIRAHVLKQAVGWNGEKQLADHFEANPELTIAYGFSATSPTEESERMQPQPPTQSRLWEIWHEEFSDDLRNICRDVATELVDLAREAGIPFNVNQHRTVRYGVNKCSIKREVFGWCAKKITTISASHSLASERE